MTRITTVFAALALTLMSACAGGGEPQRFASLSGLNAIAPSNARSVPGMTLDAEGGWEWLTESRHAGQSLYRKTQNGPDGEYVQHYARMVQDSERLTATTGTVTYSGAADSGGNPTNLPAALGTTCNGGICDYWQSDDVTLTADLDNGSARLDITEIENRTNDERYRPDGRRLTFHGGISGTEIVSNHHEFDAHLGLLSGQLGEVHSTGNFRQFTNYFGPRNAFAELMLRLAGEGPIPPQLQKEHYGAFSVVREN